MSLEERRQRGAELLDTMLGPVQAEQMRQAWRDVCPEFESYVIEFVAGEVWSRPGLDRRTRSLITIAALAALGRPLGLEINLRMALKNGATPQEVLETLLHMAVYAGFPACWEALAMARRVFGERTPSAPVEDGR